MGEHPDVVVGSVTDHEGTTMRVDVRGVDVVLTLERDGHGTAIALAPDEADRLARLVAIPSGRG